MISASSLQFTATDSITGYLGGSGSNRMILSRCDVLIDYSSQGDDLRFEGADPKA